MFKLSRFIVTLLLGATLGAAITMRAAYAEQANWRVTRSSGDVWITHSGLQPIALSDKEPVASGDIVSTGRNGRVLLSRGEETILLAANSQVEIAREAKAGYSKILQKAGAILFEVEKRNVQHFEVQTPYLAAVVKGTKFRVTVESGVGSVEVLRGQVEVSDYRSGQFALVNADQSAKVMAFGPSGISLTGPGAIGPIRQGAPRAAPLELARQPNEAATLPGREAGATREIVTAVPPAASGTPAHKMVSGDAIAEAKSQPNNTARVPNRESSDIVSGGAVKWFREAIAGRPGTYRDEDTTVVAIPAIVGVAVALGISVLRRRKRIKSDKDRE